MSRVFRVVFFCGGMWLLLIGLVVAVCSGERYEGDLAVIASGEHVVGFLNRTIPVRFASSIRHRPVSGKVRVDGFMKDGTLVVLSFDVGEREKHSARSGTDKFRVILTSVNGTSTCSPASVDFVW